MIRARTLLAAATAAALAGCAVGPDFHRPGVPEGAGYGPSPPPATTAVEGVAAGASQTLAPGAEAPAQWWTLFHDPALDALIQAALKANPDLAAAQASLRQAHELLLAQRGALAPTADVAAQAARQKDSGALSPTLATPQSVYSLYTGQVSVAYQLDLFGGVRRQVEGAAAQAEQQRYLYDAAYLSLTANVAAAAIQEAALRAQIEATQTLIKTGGDLLAIDRQEQQLGQIAGADVATQALAVAQAQAALPPLRKALDQQHDLIAALAGRFPAEADPARFVLADFTLPTSLPLTLPSRLVDQRPDIRAAEANLHAASAAVGVATAARLPDVTLSASFGGASTALSDLLAPGNQVWGLAAGVAQPVFRGGALLHQQKAAEAAYDVAKAQYRGAVVAAFRNVADALAAIEHDADSLQAAAAAEKAAHDALTIAQARQRLGQSAGASVLTFEQAYQAAVLARVQAQASRFADTVALFQALGGGWTRGAGG